MTQADTPEWHAVKRFSKEKKMKRATLYALLEIPARTMQMQLTNQTLTPTSKARLYLLTKATIFKPMTDEENIEFARQQMNPPEGIIPFIQESTAISGDSMEKIRSSKKQLIRVYLEELIGKENGSLETLQSIWQLLPANDFKKPNEQIFKEDVRETAKLIRLLTAHLQYYAMHENENLRHEIHAYLDSSMSQLTIAFELFNKAYPLVALGNLLRHRQVQELFLQKTLKEE